MTFCCELLVVTKRRDYSHNRFSKCQDNAAEDDILLGWANSSLTLPVERLHGYLQIAYWTNTRKSPLGPQLFVYYWDQIGSMPEGRKRRAGQWEGIYLQVTECKWRLPHRQGCFSLNRESGNSRYWPWFHCLRILPGMQVLSFPMLAFTFIFITRSCKMAVLTSRFHFHIQDLKGS